MQLIGTAGIIGFGLLVGCNSSGSSSSAAPGTASASDAPLDPAAEAARGFELRGTKSYALALSYFQRSCNAGNPAGCTGVGMAYLWGEGGMSKDYQKALELLNPACNNGVLRACAVVGQMHFNGWGVPTDIEKAKPLWQKICDGGEPRGCYFLGINYAAPKGPPSWHDEETGKRLLKKACDAGFKDGCDDLATLERGAAAEKLRTKVKRRIHLFLEPDAYCTGKGLPPYRWDYEGGTFAEDEQVARADGCEPAFKEANTSFCCPAQKAEADTKAEGAAQAAEAANSDTCKCWVTVCKTNVEKSEAFKTRAECDQMVNGFKGSVNCLPCACGRDVPGGDIYCLGVSPEPSPGPAASASGATDAIKTEEPKADTQDPCAPSPRSCTNDLFVQLASPMPTTPADYDYPLSKKLLSDKMEFAGVKLVETRLNGQRVMGALVKSECQAERLVKFAGEAMHTHPHAICQHIDVGRVVLVIGNR